MEREIPPAHSSPVIIEILSFEMLVSRLLVKLVAMSYREDKVITIKNGNVNLGVVRG